MRTKAGVFCLVAAAFALTATVSACGGSAGLNPQAAQTINDLGDAVNQMRQDDAMLQAQMDSLHAMVMKQDSTIQQMLKIQDAMASSMTKH